MEPGQEKGQTMSGARHDSEFDLTVYLPYLINRAGARIAAAFSEEIRDLDISLQMWRVLAALHYREGQRVGELAETTSIDVSTLSRLIGSLEKKKLAERRRAKGGDARVVTVWRTDEGRAVTESVIPVAREYEATALAGLSADEQRALKSMLVRVYHNIAALEAGRDDAAA